MNLISTMLGFIGRKIKSLETEVGKINTTLDNVSPAPKVIPIERGGTGATTTNGALDNLFGESPLPISRGGTGAVTSTDARKNLFDYEALPVAEGGTGVKSIYDGWFKYFDIKSYVLDNQTIGAGGISELTYNETRAGQRVLAGFFISNATSGGTGVSGIAVYGAYITDDGDKFVVKCKNTGTKTAKVKVVFKVLECSIAY